MENPKPKQTKKTQTRKERIIDDEIIRVMKKYKNERNPYIKASKEINKGFISKQIRQRWISKLDPDLYHGELCEDEKLYIIKWVEEYKDEYPSKNINWNQLILELKNKFGKLRSENRVKNHYYLKERQKGVPPSKDDASSSPHASSPQDRNALKSVPPSPQENNVSTTVSLSPQNNNDLKSVSFIPHNNDDRNQAEKMKIKNLLN